MNQSQHNLLFSFIWNIATDVLVHAFEFIELEEKKNNSIDMFTSILILLITIGLLFLVSEIGRYVGIADEEEDAEPFEEKMARLTSELGDLFAESHRLEAGIREKLAGIGFNVK